MHQTLTYKVYEKQNPVFVILTSVYFGISVCRLGGRKDYVAYLFTYFTGNHISEEAVCYGVSMDGYTYYALNNNKPVLDSKVISSTGGVRDPHILRGEDGQTFIWY